MCNIKAFKRYLTKQKQPQAYVAFLKKVDESTEEKAECEQVFIDVHKIEREGLPEEIWKICEEYANIFPSDLPKGLLPKRLGYEFKIDLEPNTKLVHRPIHKLSPLELEKAKSQIQYMLDHGFIRPSESPWGAPLLFAPKKDRAFTFALTTAGSTRGQSGIGIPYHYLNR